MELIPDTGIFSLEPSMAKQLLTLENISFTSSVTQSGVVTKKELNLRRSMDCEANILGMNREDESDLVLFNGVKQEQRNDDIIALCSASVIVDPQYELNGAEMACTEESNVLGTDLEPISLRFLDNNGNICGSTKMFDTQVELDVVEDIVSGEGNRRKMIVEDLNIVISASNVGISGVTKINELNLPLWGLVSDRGRMKEMEDSVAALPWFINIPSQMLTDDPHLSSTDQDLPGHVFGVYDGHGGCQVSNYCKERLHFALAEEISNAKQNMSCKFGDYNLKQRWTKVFLDCFHKLDNEIGGFPRGDRGIASRTPIVPPIAPENVGSTAVVAVVSCKQIIIANCGDSRAVLCRGKVAMPLSVDHKPNREDERKRIEAADGMVINWKGFRVSGILAMSRSIGDRYLKKYVIADPEITLVPRAKEDECLILASDGLWDVMSNEEACDLARRRIQRWHRKNGPSLSQDRGCQSDPASQDSAYFLSQIALQRGSSDNISVIVIDLKAQRKVKKVVQIC